MRQGRWIFQWKEMGPISKMVQIKVNPGSMHASDLGHFESLVIPLALLCKAQRDYAEAKQLYQQALTIRRN
jgi:hypothetical protein